MKSAYPGRCMAGMHRVHVGDDIERDGSGWSHSKCVLRRDTERGIVKRVEDGGIWLGVWDCPAGKEGTFSRQEFIEKARKRDLISEEEARLLRGLWASILMRDLSD